MKGTLRSRRTTLTVTTPDTGETWTLTNLEWMTLDITGSSVGLSAVITADTVIHRTEQGDPE